MNEYGNAFYLQVFLNRSLVEDKSQQTVNVERYSSPLVLTKVQKLDF